MIKFRYFTYVEYGSLDEVYKKAAQFASDVGDRLVAITSGVSYLENSTYARGHVVVWYREESQK